MEKEVLVSSGSCDMLLKKIDARQKEIDSLHEQVRMLEALQENQKVIEGALCKTQETFRYAIEASRDGIWDVDPGKNSISFTPRCYTMLGYHYNEFPQTRQYWQNIVHPDDRQKILAFERQFEHIQINEIEFRIRAKSGDWYWLSCHGKVVDYDDKGKPIRIVGTFSDINTRKQIEEALRNSEAHLNEAQRLAHIGSWNWDIVNDRVTWSEELYHIAGRDPGLPVPNRKEYEELLTPESFEKNEKLLDNAIKFGEPIEDELELIRHDGTHRTVVNRGVAVRDADGRVVRIAGTLQDITERKAAEEKILSSLREKEVLIREIHHRVKGNMQAISSLLNLQANQLRDPQLCRAFELLRNRLRAIALVHEKLYTCGDIAHIKFGSHTRSIVNHLIAAYGGEDIKIEMEVDEVSLDLSRAIPASLILNELVSNAIIHAFPDRSGATIKVSLRAASGNDVTLKISDNGKGLPEDIDINENDTLGLALVRVMAEQMDAVIGIKRGKGTTFTIRFSLSFGAPIEGNACSLQQ